MVAVSVNTNIATNIATLWVVEVSINTNIATNIATLRVLEVSVNTNITILSGIRQYDMIIHQVFIGM